MQTRGMGDQEKNEVSPCKAEDEDFCAEFNSRKFKIA